MKAQGGGGGVGPSLDFDLGAEGLYELVFGRVSPRPDRKGPLGAQ